MTHESEARRGTLAAFIATSARRIDDVDHSDSVGVGALLAELASAALELGLDALAERAHVAADRVQLEPECVAEELDAVRGGVVLADAFSDIAPPDASGPISSNRSNTQGEAHNGNESDSRLAIFCDEGLEHLEAAEAALIEHEAQPCAALIDEAFRALHTLKGNCGWLGLTELESTAHALEDTLDAVRAGRTSFTAEVASGVLTRVDVLRKGLHALQRGKPEAVGPEEEHEEEHEEDTPSHAAATYVRVDVQKLDNVFDEVGELITAVAAVVKNQDLEGLDLPNFQMATSRLTRVAQGLHDTATEMRMVPLESLFRKAARVVRDVSASLGKDVALDVSGADIEVDRSIVEMVTDPLLHLIRNAIDHGIESSAVRAEQGKSTQGRLALAAHYEGTEVVVSVKDDGAGINAKRLLAKARKTGLVAEDEVPTHAETLDLLFERGLSTTSTVSRYSGRGVGMDIVRSQVEAIRGSVRFETVEGQGTSFFLHLPMRLAMIDTMVVRAGSAIYAFPLLSITSSTRLDGATRTNSPDHGTLVQMRGRTMPLLDFSDLYSSHRPTDSNLVLVIDCGAQELCLRVDEIIGQRQVVVKPLGSYLGNVRAIVGCSLLGRGDLCLIVDPRQFPSVLGRSARKVAA